MKSARSFASLRTIFAGQQRDRALVSERHKSVNIAAVIVLYYAVIGLDGSGFAVTCAYDPCGPRRGGTRAPAAGRRTLRLAGTYYLLGAVALTMWLWRDPASRIVAGNPYDADQFAWFFRYDASAVAHLRLPALITTAMNAPQGISLMWNTAMPLPGVLLAPLTLLAGPQASLTVLMTLGFAGSAVSMFAVARRWGASTAAAALAGLVYGFSPALIQSSAGHYDLQFAVLPPLIIDAALRLADRARRRRQAGRGALRQPAWPAGGRPALHRRGTAA